MKRFALAAASLAAAIVFSTPVAATGAPDLKYDDMIHCAGVHMVASTIMGMNGGDTTNKDTIAKLNKQTAALMTFAELESKKDSDAVMAEVAAESEKVTGLTAKGDTGTEYFTTEFKKCNDWGVAAVQAIDEFTKTK